MEKTIIERLAFRARQFTPFRGVEQILQNLPSFQDDLEELPHTAKTQAGRNMLFVLAKLVLESPDLKKRLFEEGEKFGIHLLPTHFYSPLPTVAEVSDGVFELDLLDSPALPLHLEKQKERLREIGKYSAELAEIPTESKSDAFFWNNSAFGPIDATVYHGMIRSLAPKKVIEVGSGFSTMIATAAAKLNGSTQVMCIEPYPMPSLTANASIELIQSFIQDVDLRLFDQLGENDILFIDSTHVSRVGSDVNHIFSRILPRLKPGVFVHFHDIFLPFEYPKYWVKDEHIFWNEQYMLQNFLAFNSEFETVVSNFYWAKMAPEFLKECFPTTPVEHLRGAGSFGFVELRELLSRLVK